VKAFARQLGGGVRMITFKELCMEEVDYFWNLQLNVTIMSQGICMKKVVLR